MTTTLTAEQIAALDVARDLAIHGIPIFVARPDLTHPLGFRPPTKWQQTIPDPTSVDAWQPGDALCAVMGAGLDLLDVDSYKHPEAMRAILDILPRVYGVAHTASGGVHLFIRSLGVGSRDGLWPGVDLKGGLPGGSSRGYAFIAPTVKRSKVTDEPSAYVWVQAPAGWVTASDDDSGATIAARVRELRTSSGVTPLPAAPDWVKKWLLNKEPHAQAAAERAINAKLAEVSEWKAGQEGDGFRTVLMRAAVTLGGYVGGGYLEEGKAWERLEQAVSGAWPTPNEDDRRWIEQGLTDGSAMPFYVYTPEDEALYGEAAQAVAAQRTGEAWSVQRELGNESFDPAQASNDQELAEAFLYRGLGAYRYASDVKLGLVREPTVWTQGDYTRNHIAQVARLMPLGDPNLPSKTENYTEANWQAKRRARVMNNAGANAVAAMMEALTSVSDHPAALKIAELDNDPEILWAGGRAWALRASSEEPTLALVDPGTPHLHTAKCAPALVETPRWDAFIAEVWPDPEIRAWALRVLSVALTGHADAVVPILYGSERNGKTSVVELLCDVLGTYGTAADPKLLSSADNSHASIVYALKGARLAFIDEGPRPGRLAAERLKQLTGGGRLTGNAMRSNPVVFKPTHTLVMTTNEDPPVTDPALRARFRLIQCEGDKERVRRARQAITPAVWELEAPGVLAQMMSEAARYLADPDSVSVAAAPESIRGVADEMAKNQDPVREWVEACTVPSEPGTQASVLYEGFCAWFTGQARYRGARVPSQTAWGRSLSDQGYPPRKMRLGDRVVNVRPLSVVGGGYVLPGPVGSSLGVVGGPESDPPQGVTSEDGPSVEGVDGSLCTIQYIKENNKIYREKENRSEVSTADAKSVGLPAETGVDGPTTGPTTRETARERKAREKREAREAAIAEAAGESLPLPVVVDRAGHVVPVSVEQAAATVITAMQRAGALTVDVETTGYPVGHRLHALRTVQLGDRQACAVFDPVAHGEVIRGLLDAASVLHAHSATADLVPLAEIGLIEPERGWGRMVDTVIPAKLNDPSSTGSDPALKRLASAVLPDAVSPAADEARSALFTAGGWLTGKQKFADQLTVDPGRVGWAQVDSTSTTMLRYAASDVLDTAAIAQDLPRIPAPVLERERIAEHMTARVTHRGLAIDRDRLDALTGTHAELQEEAAKLVRTDFGIENPGSGPQVSEAFKRLGVALPTSEKGNPSIAEHVLKRIARDYAAQDAALLANTILDYRHSATVVGLFLAPYRALIEHGDGRMRPTIYTLGTDTGRMSSVRPNAQQLPRQGGIRSLVVADPGHVFVSADFASVEIRGAAALSQDPTLLQFLADDRDLHWEVARQAFGPDATKEDRSMTKRGNFGYLYGGGIPTLAREVGVSESVMAAVVDSLKLLTPVLGQWSADLKNAVRQGNTAFPAYSGRIIWLPRDYPHKAPNYAIQGTCRELLVDALVRWNDTRWRTATLLPVHDELIIQVPEEDAEDASRMLAEVMSNNLYGVPIVADVRPPMVSWADAS